MEKLNELAEQAKFVADWHGSDWSSALCQDKDGKQAHEIICESRGEAVISTGSNSNEASWLCDYLELCSPENILAIAEAFRALEQEVQKNLDGALAWQQRAEAAEAKLAELERQEPVAWHFYQWRESPKGWDWYLTRAFASEPNNSDGWRSVALFTRPAPAAHRVPEGWKLVPVEITQEMVDANFEGVCIGGIQAGYRAMLAAAPEVE